MKYKIKKGRHYASGWPFRILNYIMLPAEISGKFNFHDSCWYPTCMVDKTGINKLFGVSYGLFGVHKRSIRIGWQPNFNELGKISLFYYIYDSDVSGSYIAGKIEDVGIEEDVHFYIGALKAGSVLRLGSSEKTFPLSANSFVGHLHYPYFGGKSVSPWDMAMDVEYEVM